MVGLFLRISKGLSLRKGRDDYFELLALMEVEHNWHHNRLTSICLISKKDILITGVVRSNSNLTTPNQSHICRRQKRRGLNKGLHIKPRGLGLGQTGLIPSPLHPLIRPRPRPSILRLGVENGVGRIHIRYPRNPAQWTQKRADATPHDDRCGEILPGPAQIRLGRELVQWGQHALVDGYPRVLIRVLFTLGRDGHELVGQRLTWHDPAALENDGRISEHEVDCSGYVTIAVELAIGVRVERVLKSVERAPVENG
ncbi:transducin/WD40 repeat-like superfamily protein [Striga asiatica]|uniref:Transducin/WD40 repeat-like superfamily protein n=1 Tax=Striga asiatica TaxID=4170 RepID=A0A5A7R7F2_STRAF|nr:transducin/WD40 repeat-like superfamily protein [Striga asiatica]